MNMRRNLKNFMKKPVLGGRQVMVLKKPIEDRVREVVEGGRLPRRPSSEVDLYAIDKMLKDCQETNVRVAILRRLLEANN